MQMPSKWSPQKSFYSYQKMLLLKITLGYQQVYGNKLYDFYGSSQLNGQHMASKLLKPHFSWKQNCCNRWGFFFNSIYAIKLE